MKQRFLTLVALLTMTVTASAVNLWVAGRQVTSANMDLSDFDGVTGSVVFSQDPDTKAYTLTLTDATITGAGERHGALECNITMTLVVNGTCTIDGVDSCGVYGSFGPTSPRTLSIQGSGTLNIKGSTGVYMYNQCKLVVDGPTVVCEGTTGYGIGARKHRSTASSTTCYGNLGVQSGKVKAKGPAGSIAELGELTLGGNMEYTSPSGACFSLGNHWVETASGQKVTDWVVIENLFSDERMLATPLTLEPVTEAATVTITNITGNKKLLYAIDGGEMVTVTDNANLTIDVPQGSRLTLYGDNASYYAGIATNINCSADCYIYGNIMSLISSTDFADLKVLQVVSPFYGLFQNNGHIVNHPQARLMLPATSLSRSCYSHMFGGCKKLTEAPALPATTLAPRCYLGMFQGCSALTKAPELPAMELQSDCYSFMFYGCSSLTESPVLPAATLATACYNSMFNNCSNLSKVTCLATDLSAADCTANWLYKVSATGEFVYVPGTEWTDGANGIPTGWTKTADTSRQGAGLSYSASALTVVQGDGTAMPTLSNPNGLPVSYESSNPQVATVSALGYVTLVGPGTTVITARFAGSATFFPGVASYELTVESQGETPVIQFSAPAVVYALGTPFVQPELTLSPGLTATYSCQHIDAAAYGYTFKAATGMTAVKGRGLYKVTATVEPTLQYTGGTASYYIMALRADEAARLRCDVNGDGQVTIADMTELINVLLGR